MHRLTAQVIDEELAEAPGKLRVQQELAVGGPVPGQRARHRRQHQNIAVARSHQSKATREALVEPRVERPFARVV